MTIKPGITTVEFTAAEVQDILVEYITERHPHIDGSVQFLIDGFVPDERIELVFRPKERA